MSSCRQYTFPDYVLNIIAVRLLYREILAKCITFTFSRRFYPSAFRSYFFLSVHEFPGNRTHNLCAANAMLYHWATGTLTTLTTRETEHSYSYNKLYNLQTGENVMLSIYCHSNDGRNTDLCHSQYDFQILSATVWSYIKPKYQLWWRNV